MWLRSSSQYHPNASPLPAGRQTSKRIVSPAYLLRSMTTFVSRKHAKSPIQRRHGGLPSQSGAIPNQRVQHEVGPRACVHQRLIRAARPIPGDPVTSCRGLVPYYFKIHKTYPSGGTPPPADTTESSHPPLSRHVCSRVLVPILSCPLRSLCRSLSPAVGISRR